jgi:hypothetical protein
MSGLMQSASVFLSIPTWGSGVALSLPGCGVIGVSLLHTVFYLELGTLLYITLSR